MTRKFIQKCNQKSHFWDLKMNPKYPKIQTQHDSNLKSIKNPKFGGLWERLGTSLKRLGSVLDRLWSRLGGVLGRLGGVLGRLGRVLQASWAVSGASWSVLGASWEPLRASCAQVRFLIDFRSIFGFNFDPWNPQNYCFSIGKTRFFEKITFRS